MKKRHNEEQIIYALKRLETGSKGLEVCREMGISEQTLTDECLNVELFWSVEDARAKLEKWRLDYNVHRPHSSLANLPPAAFANELRQKKPTTNRELLTVENSS